MKLTNRILLTVFLCFLFFISTDNSVQAAVKINQTNKTMYIDDTYTLKITGTKQYILWKSSDKKIASVTKKGKITAKKTGICTITAIIGSGINNKKLSCKIKVQSRLSCADTLVRCYADEYETVRIKTKNLSKYESLVIENADNEIVSADWNDESDYFDIVFIPKKLGIAEIKVKIMYEKGRYFDIKNDSLTFFVISYPDRTGWLKNSDVDFYDCLTFIPRRLENDNAILEYKISNNSGYDLDGIYDVTRFELNPEIDSIDSENCYISNGLKYKIINNDYYFNITSLEELFFSKAGDF